MYKIIDGKAISAEIREEIKINLIFQDKLKYMSKQHLGTFRKEITELTEELEVKENCF